MAMEQGVESMIINEQRRCVSGLAAAAAWEGAVVALEDLVKADLLGANAFQKQVLERREEFSAYIREAVRAAATQKIKEMLQPQETFTPSFDSVSRRFRCLADYDESIAEKVAKRKLGSLISSSEHATDENYPDERRGKKVVSGRLWFNKEPVSQDALEQAGGGIGARPKELIDFIRAFPFISLGEGVHLVAPGQYQEVGGRRFYLCLRSSEGGGCDLVRVYLFPDNKWDKGWGFLILDRQ